MIGFRSMTEGHISGISIGYIHTEDVITLPRAAAPKALRFVNNVATDVTDLYHGC